VVAVDEGVKEVNYTLDFIASEEFITHTCCAGNSFIYLAYFLLVDVLCLYYD